MSQNAAADSARPSVCGWKLPRCGLPPVHRSRSPCQALFASRQGALDGFHCALSELERCAAASVDRRWIIVPISITIATEKITTANHAAIVRPLSVGAARLIPAMISADASQKSGVR